MQEFFENDKLVFIDENGEIIMILCYMADEFTWSFRNSKAIEITSNFKIYNALEYIMNQDYEFACEGLINEKTKDKLVWYSDCYYDPDINESREKVSFLTIERKNNSFYLKCTKPVYEELNLLNRSHTIVFSTGGNGVYTRNINTATTLQDDVAINLYHKLKSEVSKKKVLF